MWVRAHRELYRWKRVGVHCIHCPYYMQADLDQIVTHSGFDMKSIANGLFLHKLANGLAFDP